MQKRYLLVGVTILCVALGSLVMNHRYHTVLHQYIDTDTETDQLTDIIRSMSIVQFSDLPGFSGSLGDESKVNSMIAQAYNKEAEIYRPVDSLWARLPGNSRLANCAENMHTAKIRALNALSKIAGTRLIASNQIQELVKPSLAYLDQRASCQLLLRLAKVPAKKIDAQNGVNNAALPQKVYPASAPIPAPKPSTPPERGLRERFHDTALNFTGGDPEAADRMVALLSRPKTLDDWRFLAELDQAWAERDCGDAAFCFAQMDILVRAERQLKKATPPPEAEMEFLLLKKYDTGKESKD